MRILHVVPTYLPATRYGGPILSVHGLCRALARRGHEVEVFTTNVDGPGDSDVPLDDPVDLEGVRVRYFPSRRQRRIYRSPAMARALARDIHRFAVAHLHSIFLWPTMAAARACRRARIPYVVAPRGMLVRELVESRSRFVKSAWIHLVEHRTFAHAAGIHFTSALEHREAARFAIPLPDPFVVPNGVEPPTALPSEGVAPELERRTTDTGHRLLFLGRITWKKGLDRLIRALRLVDRVFLTIAGNDEENYTGELIEIARSAGVTERVEYVGWADSAMKARLLADAAALVLPSRNENFGNVVLEAMAAACPVIVTEDVGAAEIVIRERCGLVAPGEPEHLAAAIRTLLQDAEAARAMGARGRAAVERSFTWDAIAERMEAEYLRITG